MGLDRHPWPLTLDPYLLSPWKTMAEVVGDVASQSDLNLTVSNVVNFNSWAKEKVIPVVAQKHLDHHLSFIL